MLWSIQVAIVAASTLLISTGASGAVVFVETLSVEEQPISVSEPRRKSPCNPRFIICVRSFNHDVLLVYASFINRLQENHKNPLSVHQTTRFVFFAFIYSFSSQISFLIPIRQDQKSPEENPQG
jgi:hypothetical protein